MNFTLPIGAKSLSYLLASLRYLLEIALNLLIVLNFSRQLFYYIIQKEFLGSMIYAYLVDRRQRVKK